MKMKARREQRPSPLPVVSTRVRGCVDGVATVADDLSSATASGMASVYRQDCDVHDVCFPGSTEGIGDESVSAAWTATDPIVPHASTSVAHLTTIRFDECTSVTTQTGTRREATAELVWEGREPGDLSSAWIGEITERVVRTCRPPR